MKEVNEKKDNKGNLEERKEENVIDADTFEPFPTIEKVTENKYIMPGKDVYNKRERIDFLISELTGFNDTIIIDDFKYIVPCYYIIEAIKDSLYDMLSYTDSALLDSLYGEDADLKEVPYEQFKELIKMKVANVVNCEYLTRGTEKFYERYY